jgi:NDP-sugar pyrophosphorylase family protein
MPDIRFPEAAILAAGFGTRLLPITDYIPKPLLPILARPLLENIILSLKQQGVRRMCINVHHKKERVIDFLRNLDHEIDIALSEEEVILGTGGGIGRMKELIEGDDFIVHNGDIITDLKLHDAITFHKEKKGLATLILVKNENSKDVLLGENNRIDDIAQRIGKSGTESSLFDFTGIAILNRRVFDRLPEDRYYDILDMYTEAVSERDNIFGFVCKGGYWRDIGTKRKYLQVHRDILIDRKNPLLDFTLPHSSVFIERSAAVTSTAHLKGFVSIGKKCIIGDGVELEDCVVLDGTILDGSQKYSHCILSNAFIASAEPNDG